MELKDIKGLGPKTIEALSKLEIYNYNDLIRYYPYRYNIYTPIDINTAGDDIVVVSGIVESSPKTAYIRRNFTKTSFIVLTSNIRCNVIIFNRAFLSKSLYIGKGITLIGRYNKLNNTFTASDIKQYEITETKVEPVYHIVSGIKRSALSKAINNALDLKHDIYEIVPSYLQEKYNFISDYDAIKEIHNPTSIDKLKQAKIKLKYEELFEFMFKINLIKLKNQVFGDFVTKDYKPEYLSEILDSLPFKLTNDQLNAINDCIKDFTCDKRMNRLVLGDVGSGKTMVAFVAMLLNQKSGYQSAMLAPTEVLARQHFANIQSIIDPFKTHVALLVGSTPTSEKKEILAKLETGEIDILIGTHAIIEDKVKFNNIGLVITDEQHRFGVNQRKALQNKGRCVDVLYMSATPIPRTYALTIYGDMDISVIKEKPSGRKEIITSLHKTSEIASICAEMVKELDDGHQVYVISPLIDDDDEESDLTDIEETTNTLRKYLPSKYTIGTLHGKMKPKDKDDIMNEFKENNINVLVSTTVIEVGVDVKNATMMVIFNAERFGLATLHQLRGRVGRNELQSKCILISDKEAERLNVLCESNDGFYISEKDFELRGSGDLFGIRQSGDMVFKIADIHKDMRILMQCKTDSEAFINQEIENGFANYPYYKYIEKELINNN